MTVHDSTPPPGEVRTGSRMSDAGIQKALGSHTPSFDEMLVAEEDLQYLTNVSLVCVAR